MICLITIWGREAVEWERKGDLQNGGEKKMERQIDW